MRSNLLGMCSAVAAVAVAGSASAGVSIDAFTNSVIPQINASYGGIFSARQQGEAGSVSSTIDTVNNRLMATVGAENSFLATTWGNWDALDNWGAGINLSQLSTITFDVSTTTASRIDFVMVRSSGNKGGDGGDEQDPVGSVGWRDVAVAAGTSSITLTVGQDSGGTWTADYWQFETAALDLTTTLSGVNSMDLRMKESFNGYVSNLQYNLVPAPGAAALVGLAGLVGGRRRKA